MRGRALRWLLSGLALLALALVATAIALSQGWQRERLRAGVEQWLSSALDAPVAIEALDGPLWPSFALRGLEMEGVAGIERLAARRVAVDLGGFAPGEVPRLSLERLEIEGARVRIAPDAEGRWPWQQPSDEAGEGEPSLELWIAAIALQDAVVMLSSDERTLRVALEAEARGARLGSDLAAEHLAARFAAATRRAAAPAEPGEAPGPAEGGAARDDPPWEEWARGRIEGRHADGRWQVALAQVEGEVLRAEAHGAGDADGVEDAHVAFEVPSLAALAERLPGIAPDAAGRVAGSADVSGAWSALRGTLRADGDGIRVGDLEAGAVSLHVQSEQPGELWLEALRIDGPDLGLRATERARIGLREQAVVIESLALALRDGSTLAIDASLPHAVFETPRSLLARGPAARLHVVAQGWSLGAVAPLLPLGDFTLRGTLDADLALTRRAGARPTARGRASLADGAVEASALAIEDIAIDLDLEGDPEDPSGSASGRLRGVVAGGRALGDVRFSLRSPGQRVVVVEELFAEDGAIPVSVAPGSRFALDEAADAIAFENVRVSSAGQTLRLDGAMGLDGRCDFDVAADALDVAVLADLARPDADPETQVPLAGRLSGEIQCRGALDAPALAGELRWTQARIDVFEFERIEARLTSDDGVQRLDGAWIRDGDVLLEIEARAPAEALAEPATLLESPGLRVQAAAREIDLAVLRPFLPEATPSVRGPLTGEVTLVGGRPSPELSGWLALRGGSVRIEPLRDPLAPIDLRIELRDDVLELRELAIGAPGAGVTGTGRVQLAGDGDATLSARLDFDALPLAVPGLVSGRVYGGLALAGALTAPELNGELELARLEISLPEQQSPELKEIQILAAGDRAPALEITEVPDAPSWFDPVAMDVAVEIRRNSWVRGRGAEVEIAGDLRVRKAQGRDPRLSGEIETLRGRYDAYGRRFQVQRGRAILDGSWPPDPLLEVRAERRIRDVTIIASLEGRLSAPRLELDSVPSMNETDIASYLVFGRPASDLGAGEQQAVGAVAGRVAAGMAVRELEQIFQGRLPVDVIDVQVEENEGRSELGLGVGRYIGDRLFIRYGRTFGEQAVDEVRGEVELTPNWSLEGSAATDGTTGADIIFHFDY